MKTAKQHHHGKVPIKAGRSLQREAHPTVRRTRLSFIKNQPTLPIRKLAPEATALEVVEYCLAKTFTIQSHYFYQLPLGNQKLLYSEIGTFSSLFGVSDDNAFKILTCAGLAGMHGTKKIIRQQAWEKLNIPNFKVDTKGEDKTFIFGVGNNLNEQIQNRENAPRNSEEIKYLFKKHPTISNILTFQTRHPSCIDDVVGNTSSNLMINSGEVVVDVTSHLKGIITKKRKPHQRRVRETEIGGVKAIVANGYKGVHKLTLIALQEASKMKTAMLAAASKKKSELVELDKIFLGTLASRFPQASDLVVEQMIFGGGLLCGSQLQLFDGGSSESSTIKFDTFHQILPSRTTISSAVKCVAAHKIIHQGVQMLKAKRVFIGCDKGGGVLVKLAFYFDKIESNIRSINLDFDKAGDDAEGGGKAIKQSVSKYTFPEDGVEDIGIKFNGGGSDSGGGFTGTAMFNELQAVNLVKDPFEWIHIACTSHNDQTNLRVAMESVYGTGGLEARTVQQLLHSFQYVQQQLGGALEIKPLLQSAWNFVRGTEEPIPKRVLQLMPEPILTRWGTVGEASCWINDFGDVANCFCKGICGASWSKTSHSVHQGASNFRSLFREMEITLANSFIASFDHSFFREHLEFDHATDPHIGRSGFLCHHHLVRYFLKSQEIEILVKEVDAAISWDGLTPFPNKKQAVLSIFWQKLQSSKASFETKKKTIRTAVVFLQEYKASMVKHHEQWVRPKHLFLGAFGEVETAQIVARHLLGMEDTRVSSRSQYFESPLHKKKIDRFAFSTWLEKQCPKEIVNAAIKSPNFVIMKDAIIDIAKNGWDIWNDNKNLLAICHKNMYLEEFGALPSTMEIVERAVKKAKLCQQTGKGERAVTAYGIAGDSISERCPRQYVSSSYSDDMSNKRRSSQERAQEEGRNSRSQQEYDMDIERGPGLMINTYHHTLECLNNANIARDEIGHNAYEERLNRTVAMLTSLENNSSFLRYGERREDFEAAMQLTDDDYKQSAREQEMGVSVTPLMRGEVPLGKLLKKDNHHLIFEECVARGLVSSVEGMKMPLFTDLGKLIKENERSTWIAANPGKAVPDTVGKTFKPISGAKFVVNNK